VRLVYPEIQGGRVIADVEVPGLGDYFVGERTRVYIDAGMRRTLVVPASYVYRRAGVNYVRLTSGDEIVVQPGDPRDIGGANGVEILTGLKDGDTLAAP
jgi:membrane fusion protein, multidrug efflux system